LIHLTLLTLLLPMATMPAPALSALQVVIVLAGALLLTLLGGWLIGWFLQPFQAQLNKKFRPNSLRPV